jgi:hypothetical protein
MPTPARPIQPSLFDLVKELPATTPAPILDIKQGRVDRDNGIKAAVDHADRVSEGWSDKAYQFLLKFLNNHNGPFMAEEIRSAAALMDFELPPSARAWGAVVLKAAKAGIIERVGIQKVKNKTAHCANATVWQQARKRVSD